MENKPPIAPMSEKRNLRDKILELIKQGKIDATPLITHTFALKDIERAYELFENREDGVVKVAIRP